MNKNKVQTTFMNVGASSLLVIFLILCISIFATLSLSSAKSDYSFSEDMAKHKTNYYNASNTSERILDEVDAFLAETAVGAAGQQDFYARVRAELKQEFLGIPVAIDDSGAQPVLTWQVPIDDTQLLHVRIAVQWPYGEISQNEDTKGFYRIETWRTAAQ